MYPIRAPVAQWTERLTSDQTVVSSNLAGGANDVGSFCHRTMIILRQDRRKFAEQVDFITTPGYLTGPGAREKAGLPAHSGPYRVITQI